MELYSSIMKLAPLLLLKILTMDDIGPLERVRGTRGRVAVAGYVALVVSVVAGGLVAVLVLGDVMTPTTTTRWTVVLAGCLSLLLLTAYMLREIASLHKARQPAKGTAPSAGASGSQGQAS